MMLWRMCHLSQGVALYTQLNLPMNHVVPGSELTKEPFRWDQRLFGLVLRLPAVPPSAEMTQGIIPSADDAAVDAMCEVTGGQYRRLSVDALFRTLITDTRTQFVLCT